jgi:transcription elongation factor Elf1
MWLSFTPPGPFPCPFCYLYERKVSPLKPLPRMEDVEPVRCSECGETFEIPVELLYA